MTDRTETNVWIDDYLIQDEGITVLLNSEEPALPGLRNLNVTVPGRHGDYDFGAYFESRQFTLNCVFPRQSYTDLKAQIRVFVRRFLDDYGRPKTVKLRFGDEVDKFYNVRLSGGIDPERVAERGFFALELTAHDPYAYSEVSNEEITWGSEVITFEWTYLLGTGGTGGGVSINAPTTLDAYVYGELLRPVIEISGSATSMTVSANGKSFSLPAFTNTAWVIDGENYTVTRNGNYDLAALTGDFIALTHGDNVINVTGTGLDVQMTIKYRNKYL